jgi:hypothetical protein
VHSCTGSASSNVNSCCSWFIHVLAVLSFRLPHHG